MDTSFYLSCAGELGGLNWHNKKKKEIKPSLYTDDCLFTKKTYENPQTKLTHHFLEARWIVKHQYACIVF